VEDCPEVTSFAPASQIANKGDKFVLQSSLWIYPKDNTSKVLAVQAVDASGNITITFESPRDQKYLIRLNSFRKAMVQNLTTDTNYKAGINKVTLNVADLKVGVYFLKLKGLSATYRRIVIAN
jgi:hypothetical protein